MFRETEGSKELLISGDSPGAIIWPCVFRYVKRLKYGSNPNADQHSEFGTGSAHNHPMLRHKSNRHSRDEAPLPHSGVPNR